MGYKEMAEREGFEPTFRQATFLLFNIVHYQRLAQS